MRDLPFPTWTWIAASLAIGVAAGIVIGKSGAESSGSSAAAGEPVRATKVPRGGDAALERGSGSPADRGERPADGGYSTGPDAAHRMLSLLDSPSRLDRIQRLLAFLDRLPDDQFAAVYAEFRNSPLGKDRQSERALVLQAWAERDPLAATTFLQQQGAEDWERETTLSAWAAADPRGAFAWAAAAEDAGQINNWVVGALRGIASASPELARDYLVGIDNERTQRECLRDIQNSIMRHGFDAGADWIAGLESGTELHQRAARYLANDLTALDPVAAGRWTETLADTDTRREVSETVSEMWARDDLDAAREWVESLPRDTIANAAEGITETWAGRDPDAAARWLDSLGDDPALDGARRDYVREAYREHPEAALDMAISINDANDRNRYTRRYLERWSREDTQAAQSWVAANQNVLAPEIVERVFRRE